MESSCLGSDPGLTSFWPYVSQGRLVNCSEPPFPHLSSEDSYENLCHETFMMLKGHTCRVGTRIPRPVAAATPAPHRTPNTPSMLLPLGFHWLFLLDIHPHSSLLPLVTSLLVCHLLRMTFPSHLAITKLFTITCFIAT